MCFLVYMYCKTGLLESPVWPLHRKPNELVQFSCPHSLAHSKLEGDIVCWLDEHKGSLGRISFLSTTESGRTAMPDTLASRNCGHKGLGMHLRSARRCMPLSERSHRLFNKLFFNPVKKSHSRIVISDQSTGGVVPQPQLSVLFHACNEKSTIGTYASNGCRHELQLSPRVSARLNKPTAVDREKSIPQGQCESQLFFRETRLYA